MVVSFWLTFLAHPVCMCINYAININDTLASACYTLFQLFNNNESSQTPICAIHPIGDIPDTNDFNRTSTYVLVFRIILAYYTCCSDN